jgi:hypothetical protein
MSRLYVFADEAGCMEFSRKQNASKYFMLCTVSMETCDVGHELLDLRRKLAIEGAPLRDYFHAAHDMQVIRNAVFDVICRHKFDIHVTILEKSKAYASVRSSSPRFYQYGWYYHFRHLAPIIAASAKELLTTAASIGTNKERAAFLSAIDDVMGQTLRGVKWKTNFCPAGSDPCLQVADYCAWAIQRKWEAKQDTRSYDRIKHKICSEFDLWSNGTKHHY